MSRALDQSNKFSYQLVKFTYGDPASPTYSAYTNWTDNIPGDPVYASTPALLVKLPENVGTVENKQAKITLPRDTFTDALSSGLPVSPIKVEIVERVTAWEMGDSSTSLVNFKGTVAAAVRHPNGKRGVVELTIANLKIKLDVPMGIPATHQCVWTFGEGPCQAIPQNNLGGVFISAIEGKKITVTGLAPGFADRNFRRGYILRQGVRVGIREWRSADYNTLYLVRQIPADWISPTVGISVYAGCDRTIECCRTRPLFSGEEYFMGCGFSIPNYNPLIEDGG